MWRALVLGWSLALSLLAAFPAFAWGDDGHKIVCEIAYRNVTPAAKSAIDHLIQADGQFATFPDSCPLADHLNGDPAYEPMPSWHFLNMRPGDPTVDKADCDPVKHCVLYAIDHFLAELEDKKLSEKKRAQALEFLAHFVADVHQPLHVSFAADRGGNDIHVLWLFGEQTNLHSIWDFIAIQTEEREQWPELPEGQRWRRYADLLAEGITKTDRKTWTGGTPVSWAQESYDMAQSPDLLYVGAVGGETVILGRDYFHMAIWKIDSRLKAAGLRLAEMLNKALGR
jgi:hypothetical protein